MHDFPTLTQTAKRLATLPPDAKAAIAVFLSNSDLLGDNAYAHAVRTTPAAVEWLDEFTQQYCWLLDVADQQDTYRGR